MFKQKTKEEKVSQIKYKYIYIYICVCIIGKKGLSTIKRKVNCLEKSNKESME
jgi:hypothetical protein